MTFLTLGVKFYTKAASLNFSIKPRRNMPRISASILFYRSPRRVLRPKARDAPAPQRSSCHMCRPQIHTGSDMSVLFFFVLFCKSSFFFAGLAFSPLANQIFRSLRTELWGKLLSSSLKISRKLCFTVHVYTGNWGFFGPDPLVCMQHLPKQCWIKDKNAPTLQLYWGRDASDGISLPLVNFIIQRNIRKSLNFSPPRTAPLLLLLSLFQYFFRQASDLANMSSLYVWFHV